MLHESQFVNVSQKHLFLPNSPFDLNNQSEKVYTQIAFEPQQLEMMFDILPFQKAVSQQFNKNPSKFSNLKQPTPYTILQSKRSIHHKLQSTMSNYQYQKEPLKSQKGTLNQYLYQQDLNICHIKVKQIVFEFKLTSYKDVAERLIKEYYQEQDRILDYDNSKDEQNIKRRVYDALNVMIASRVLKKEGKTVKANFDNSGFAKNLLKLKSLHEEQLNKKQKIIEMKKKQLADIVWKVKAANSLIERNKSLEFNEQQQLFYFPILTFTQDAKHPKFIKDKKLLKILMKSKTKFTADLDIVKQLYIEQIDSKYLLDECQNLYI
ncbi:unnamed protein product (macronuclear) [Paramecium tetraurelia]|uniref:E2F/DP family winged-helix DNA-binding domain-containing protein n=1 Tax=Paramecium tetraurelia TaxID=5888 RepID=A0E158_PARTE|nr:uncharacterized protein GSPATT00022194001 [Paramecium tetraurelia]CAK89025.1 unnamed protein product [Paramecium tetraurelia]|eukprot:XP_001456422.1 hypothetical protein (macronuclear) [Paramecium tetraurelia strain d4-2]